MLKNATLQCDLRRVNFGVGKRLPLLCLLGITTALLLFLWPNAGPAYADTLEISNYTGSWYSDVPRFQSFTPATNFSLSKISVCIPYFENPIEGNSNYLNLKNYDGDILASSTPILQTDFNADNQLPCGAGMWHNFTFPTPYFLTASTTYYFQWAGDGVGAGTHALGSSVAVEGDVYAGGCGGTNIPTCHTGGNVFDVLFEIYSAPTNTISIIFPENTTSTPDFNYWGFSGYNISTSTVLIHINWGASTSTWTGFGNPYDLDNIGAFSINNAPKTSALSVGVYYAQAWLLTCPSPYNFYSDCIPSTWNTPYGMGLFTPIATSTIISFTITGENPYIGGYYGTYYPTSTPTSTATSSEWVITCDPNDPLWSRSICQLSKWVLDGILGLLKFLFIPKDSDFQQFTNLKSMLEHKAPMGYFYAIKDALQFNSTTTKAFDLASSTVAMVSPIFNPLKTGITFILWLLFAFWLFNRIRHFNL